MNDKAFMEIAIEEALRGKGKTLPNPAVGAVIVKDGKIVATGFHEKSGKPHAEALAIEKAGEKAKGATLYVTLEPCNHYGKTPPCTKKIIESSIKKVIIGIKDPNEKAAGGVETLKKAGIEVSVGLCKKECIELIDDFLVTLKLKRPFCSLKLAATLDGKIAKPDGKSKWITSEESRKLVHRIRSFHNGIMVGINTVLKDDPLLNVRYVSCDKQPKAIVVDKNLKIPVHAKLVKERAKDLIIITSQDALFSYKKDILQDFGVSLLPVSLKGNFLDMEEAFKLLMSEYSIYSIMCEGGSKLAASLVEADLIDKYYLFYAPKLFGEGLSMLEGKALDKEIEIFSVESTGIDYLVKGYSKNFIELLK